MKKIYEYQGNEYRDYKGKAQKEDKIILREMMRIREIELKLASLYHEDEMKTPLHLAVGQEATAVGACSAMNKNDKIYLSHRTHGPYLAKGGDLYKMVAELFGKGSGCSGSRGGSMHLIDKSNGVEGASAIVGGIVPIATGAALAAQRLKKTNFTTVFFGDAAMEEGVVSESFNVAALWKLPILYFCENNFYSVCTPLNQRQPDISLADKAQAFGIPSLTVDGNNVFAVREAVSEALARAQKGDGPTFIEAKVYRWLAHAGAYDDTATGYRSKEEVEKWKKACPIVLLKQFLIQEGLLTELECATWEKVIHQEISEIIEKVRSEPYPDPKTLLHHVYAQ